MPAVISLPRTLQPVLLNCSYSAHICLPALLSVTHIHLYTNADINSYFEHGFLFFSCTIVAVIEALQPVTTVHHQQPVGSLHESDSLIPCLNYCLNEQETRTRTVRAPPSLTRLLSVSHPSPSLFHFGSFAVSITFACLS